jgi:amidase
VRAALQKLASELQACGGRVDETLPALDFSAQRKLFTRLYLQLTGAFALPAPTLAEHLTALQERDLLAVQWDVFFQEWDVLLCPVSMSPAFPHCETGTPIQLDGEAVRYWENISHTCPFNLTGLPALAMPLGFSRQGLPIGVQIVTRRWGESLLLGAARALCEITPGFQAPPGYAINP